MSQSGGDGLAAFSEVQPTLGIDFCIVPQLLHAAQNFTSLIVTCGNNLRSRSLPEMDETKVIQACRLLRAVLRADPELRRMVLHVERDRVLLTTFPKSSKAGTQLVVDQDLIADNVRQLDEWR
jgi:hypothetical protein